MMTIGSNTIFLSEDQIAAGEVVASQGDDDGLVALYYAANNILKIVDIESGAVFKAMRVTDAAHATDIATKMILA